MAFDLSRPDLVSAVFGTGTMGRGIAQLCAQAGLTTLLFDSNGGAVTQAIAAIDKGLEGLVSKGRMAQPRGLEQCSDTRRRDHLAGCAGDCDTAASGATASGACAPGAGNSGI